MELSDYFYEDERRQIAAYRNHFDLSPYEFAAGTSVPLHERLDLINKSGDKLAVGKLLSEKEYWAAHDAAASARDYRFKKEARAANTFRLLEENRWLWGSGVGVYTGGAVTTALLATGHDVKTAGDVGRLVASGTDIGVAAYGAIRARASIKKESVGSGGGGGSREKTGDPHASFEPALNEALKVLGEINPATRLPSVGRLGVGKGKVVGFETMVGTTWKRLRIDFDPQKGPHINVEIGKGPTAIRYAARWKGTEQDVKSILRSFQL
jgi:hypothetical protein